MIRVENLGSVDRIIRIIVGLVLVFAPYYTAFAVWENAAMRWLVPIVGIVLLLTALFRFCPLYRLLGINTCKV